jgi:transcriptional regulator with XRE-family HTH domain
MSEKSDLEVLIDRASALAGSDGKLAAALGVSRQVVSDWRHGRRTATPEDQALLAAHADLDPILELARATVRKHEGTAKGDLLMKALGKALPAIGAGLASAGAHAQGIGSMIPVPSHALEWAVAGIYTMYIRLKRVMTIRVMSTV